MTDRNRKQLILYLVSAVLELIAFMYIVVTEGLYGFRFYTIDSNTLLSVVTLLFMDKKIPKYAVIMPAAFTIIYGIIALILNFAKVLTGPYFFLEVYSTPAGTIAMWFGIILVLCVALAAAYMFIHSRIIKSNK